MTIALPGCTCGQKTTSSQKLWGRGFHEEARGDISVIRFACIACNRHAVLTQLNRSHAFFCINIQGGHVPTTENVQSMRRALKINYSNPAALADTLLGMKVHQLVGTNWQEVRPTPTLAPILPYFAQTESSLMGELFPNAVTY